MKKIIILVIYIFLGILSFNIGLLVYNPFYRNQPPSRSKLMFSKTFKIEQAIKEYYKLHNTILLSIDELINKGFLDIEYKNSFQERITIEINNENKIKVCISYSLFNDEEFFSQKEMSFNVCNEFSIED